MATEVIPLLMSILPGIDPNDYDKTLASTTLIGTFANLIPLRDASKYLERQGGVSELEALTCKQSSQYADFMRQYLDR